MARLYIAGMRLTTFHEPGQQVRNFFAIKVNSGHPYRNLVAFLYIDTAIRTRTKPDKLRFLFPDTRRTDNKRSHRTIPTFLYNQSMIQNLSVPFNSLICQQNRTFLFRPIQINHCRSRRIIYQHFQTRYSAKLR